MSWCISMIKLNGNYETRDGRSVEVVSVSGRKSRPVLAYIGDKESLVYAFKKDGRRLVGRDSNYDLFEVDPFKDLRRGDILEIEVDGSTRLRTYWSDGCSKDDKLNGKGFNLNHFPWKLIKKVGDDNE